MWRVLFLILFVILGYVLVDTGWLRGLGGPVELGSFILGISLAGSIWHIAFRIHIWTEAARAFFRGRPAALNPGPSAAQMLWNFIRSNLQIMGVFVTAIVTGLEYEGRHDVVVQIAEIIVTRMGRIVAALTH